MAVLVTKPAPDFSAEAVLKDGSFATLSLSPFKGKYVLLFFYPLDFTFVCPTEIIAFSERVKEFNDLGVEVIGVSGDTVSNHKIFKQVHKLNFPLLADEKGEVAKLFGVPLKAGGVFKTKDADGKPVELKRDVTAARWTFVIGKDGKILSVNSSVKAAEDSKQVLELIEKLAK